MDSRFFQFWDDFIKQTADGGMLPAAFSDWMGQGTEMPETVMEMFKKYYGLDQAAPDSPDYTDLFDAAIKEFNDSLANFYSMIDAVPKNDFLELEKKYKALKQKVADQEEMIKQLKLLLKIPSEAEDGIKSLNQMLKSQNQNFLKMMESLADFYGISKKKDAEVPED